jgi:hypothetical protein
MDCCPGYVTSCEKSAIACGSDVCSLNNSFCCQEWNGSSYTPACQAKSSSCGGTEITCNGPEDCGSGQVCCGQIGATGAFDQFSCVPSGNCQYTNNQRVICGTAPSSCPSGFVCKTTSYPPGYGYCGKPTT